MTGTLATAVAGGIFVVYVFVVLALWLALGVRYDRLGDSPRSVARGIVLPIGVGALLLAVATTVLGWWPAALVDLPSTAWWSWIAPGLLTAAIIVLLSAVDVSAPRARILPVLAVGTLLVGFAEELLVRGILVVGLREAGLAGGAVIVVTSLAFGLLHGINSFVGQPWRTTGVQVALATLLGLVFFEVRAATGLLAVGMVLHALWDFGVIAGDPRRVGARAVANGLLLAAIVAAAATVWWA